MKLSKGRGIKFYNQPFFEKHSEYVAKIYGAGKKHVDSVFSIMKSKAGKGKNRK